MTISYTAKVDTSHSTGFLRLFRLLKGSLIKAVGPDLVVYLLIYYFIGFIYRFALTSENSEDSKQRFEHFCQYCLTWKRLIPLQFILAFYVSQVVTRWWSWFNQISWPDTIALYMMSYMPGKENRDARRTIVRWVCLSSVLTWMGLSSKVADRFPSYERLKEAHLITESEMKKIKKLDAELMGRHSLTYLPLMWADLVFKKLAQEGKIHMREKIELVREVERLRGLNSMMGIYAWIPIPLAYTQVVVVAVYSYFLASLFGNQFLRPTYYKDNTDSNGTWDRVLNATDYFTGDDAWGPPDYTAGKRLGLENVIGQNSVDFYIPVFGILEFIFFNGWLRVAGAMLNPFGNDDDDFDLNYIIDRNMTLGYLIANEEDVEMEPDPFGNLERPPIELPHTEISHRDGAFAKKSYRRKLSGAPPPGYYNNSVNTDAEKQF